MKYWFPGVNAKRSPSGSARYLRSSSGCPTRKTPAATYRLLHQRWPKSWSTWSCRVIAQIAPHYYRIGFSICLRSVLAGSLHQNTSDKNWRNRRSQKLDKMELLTLQSSLQSEIQAKAAIAEELSRTRADLVAAQKYAARIFCFHKHILNCILFLFTETFARLANASTQSAARWNARTDNFASCSSDWKVAKAVSVFCTCIHSFGVDGCTRCAPFFRSFVGSNVVFR